MLSQKIALHANTLIYLQFDGIEIERAARDQIEALDDAQQRMADNHSTLLNLIKSQSISAKLPAELEEIYFGSDSKLDIRVKQYSQKAIELARLATTGQVIAGSWPYDQEDTDKLLKDLNHVVTVLEKLAQERVSLLMDIETALYSSTLLVLLFELFVIFKPLESLVLNSLQKIKREQIKAEDASKAKSEFLASMSHELRTPLNGIIGMYSLIKMESDPNKQKEYLEHIESSSKHLLMLINDILDLSKIEAQQLNLEQHEFSLEQLIAGCVKPISVLCQQKGIGFEQSLAPNLPNNCIGDSTKLAQVLNNLLSNALKFTEKGKVELEVDVEENNGLEFLLKIRVKDSGIGIAPDKQAHIFDKFTQGDSSTTRKYGGTGLGLCISKQLVELMGGEMTLSSELGKGSEFSFFIKLQPSKSRAPQDVMSSKSIAVIDDRNNSRGYLSSLLASIGAKVDTYVTLDDFIEAKQFDYSLIVIDLHVSEFQAFPSVKKLQQTLGESSTSIFVLSTLEDQLSEAVKDAQPNTQFLVFPMEPDELIREVKNELTHQSSEPLQSIRVLLAEDNPVNAKIVSTILDKKGHEVEWVTDGQQALDRLSNSQDAANFDLVLMDINMPVMDGLQATKQIREQIGNALPIVALSANAFEADVKESLAAGMNRHLTKPIQLPALEQLIEDVATGRI
jgi:signal transduction histidine kinase/CheY-like chemotaxis protein